MVICLYIYIDQVDDAIPSLQDAYQKYAMYIESNANLLINGYLPHTTDLMV